MPSIFCLALFIKLKFESWYHGIVLRVFVVSSLLASVPRSVPLLVAAAQPACLLGAGDQCGSPKGEVSTPGFSDFQKKVLLLPLETSLLLRQSARSIPIYIVYPIVPPSGRYSTSFSLILSYSSHMYRYHLLVLASLHFITARSLLPSSKQWHPTSVVVVVGGTR